MYKLDESYGKKTFDTWNGERPRDLGSTQTNPEIANREIWHVSSFRELIENVAFLGSMNKRLTLLYRGQSRDWDPLPTLFRDSWTCFGSDQRFGIDPGRRIQYWNQLERIGGQVYEVCNSKGFGLPRWRGLRNIREVQWAVIQHYGLWPTPFIDLTSSVRAAATFALDFKRGSARNPCSGFLYVVGMPYYTGSITFDIDENLVLARLHSSCPPIARRPHYQEGFLVGRFPMYSVADTSPSESRLVRRLIAKFKLEDTGHFWNEDFPMLGQNALLPADDPLLKRFLEEFGPRSNLPLHTLAESFK
jgi:hypothetical protein